MPQLSRRDFLLTGLASGALLAVPSLTAQTTAPATPAAARHARNVIFLVSDGMSLGTLFTLFVTPAIYTIVARDHSHDRERLGLEPAQPPQPMAHSAAE